MQADLGDRDQRTPRGVGRRLTDRQAALLSYIAAGLENKEIAQRLGIAEQTVKEQVSNLLSILAARNRAKLAEIATQLRILGTTIEPAWLDYFFNKAPFGIAIMRGPEFRNVTHNDYYRRCVGGRELAGKTLREVFPDWAPESYAVFERAYSTGEPVTAHEYAARWDRLGAGPEDGFADFVLQPLRDDAGVVNGMLMMCVDVTDTVRARRTAEDLPAE